MDQDKDASGLAKEFFTAGNIVTGFYVVQTILFLNSILKELELWKVLSGGKVYAVLGTLFIAIVYIIVIRLCLQEETRLRKKDGQSDAVCHAVRRAGLVRTIIILALALMCAGLLVRLPAMPTEVKSVGTQNGK